MGSVICQIKRSDHYFSVHNVSRNTYSRAMHVVHERPDYPIIRLSNYPHWPARPIFSFPLKQTIALKSCVLSASQIIYAKSRTPTTIQLSSSGCFSFIEKGFADAAWLPLCWTRLCFRLQNWQTSITCAGISKRSTVISNTPCRLPAGIVARQPPSIRNCWCT